MQIPSEKICQQLSGYDESKFLEADEKLKGGFLPQTLRSLPISKSPVPKLDTFASDSTMRRWKHMRQMGI